jgi:hypothetical protein
MLPTSQAVSVASVSTANRKSTVTVIAGSVHPQLDESIQVPEPCHDSKTGFFKLGWLRWPDLASVTGKPPIDEKNRRSSCGTSGTQRSRNTLLRSLQGQSPRDVVDTITTATTTSTLADMTPNYTSYGHGGTRDDTEVWAAGGSGARPDGLGGSRVKVQARVWSEESTALDKHNDNAAEEDPDDMPDGRAGVRVETQIARCTESIGGPMVRSMP